MLYALSGSISGVGNNGLMAGGIRIFLMILVPVVPARPAAALDRGATASPRALAAGKRVALVIGNGAYRHAPALPNPANDARDMAGLLEGLGFDVVFGVNLDRLGMEDRIRAFADRSADAAVTLFYYAGHGMQVDGRNYLIPVDAALSTASALQFETVEADTVLRFMVGGDRIAIALLDACRDNPLSRSFVATRSAGTSRGLALPATGGGIMIGFATAPGETAADGDGRNSPFAAALLRHLGAPGMEISRTMRRVMADVSSATGDRQRPWIHSDIAVDFYLNPDPAEADDTPAVARPAPAARPARQELAARAPEPKPGRATGPGGEAASPRPIGVVGDQGFGLCGLGGLKAAPPARRLRLSRLDRGLAGRPLRGHEKALPLDTPVELWKDCSVTAGYEAKAGVARITLSVTEGR